MSLFKTQDWWSSTPEGEEGSELCNIGSLLVADVTNDDSAYGKIVVCGFSGILRIFNPQENITEDGDKMHGFKPDHLLLEVNLGLPTMQLAAGKFVSGSESIHLCTLHPDHFVIYSVIAVKGQADYGTQIKLNKVYQHSFQRKAFSLTTGNFGSVKGRDFIAVQSLDGCISFYEQESLGFTCFLPGFLLPGPMAYLPKSDTVVTQASDWTMQSYKYQTLSVLGQDDRGVNSKLGGKRIQPEWTQIMSEAALDIKILVEPGNVSSIIILTTHSFMCYKDSGTLKFIKKLEYNPSCFTAFHNEKLINVCVASHTSNLLVHIENDLKWAAQLSFVPVSMERADFVGIKGALVLLGETGNLQVCYLGTDPSLFTAPPSETREINYEATDQEMAQLNKIIRSSTKDTGSLLSLNKKEKALVVSTAIGSQLESWVGPTRVNDPDGIPSVTVVIRLTTPSPINNVRVNIHVEMPLGVTQNTFVLGTVCDTSQILVKFYLAESYTVSNLHVNIIASYLSANGSPHISNTDIQLPLKLVMKPSAPNKEADYKITISTNKPAVNLPDLFPEFGLDGSVSTALGLQYYGGASVTVLSSRTSNRYRLQSDSLAALWILLEEVCERLKTYWAHNEKETNEPLTLGITSSLPLQDLYNEIDAHFMRRKKYQELEAQLVQRAVQFRAVQKRLLTKFKDKTPTPLTNLDSLLEGTYKQILQITEAINQNMAGLEEDGSQLSCVLRLLLKLLSLQTELNEEQKDLLMAALTPIVHPNMDQGWEEIADSSVSFVLRSIMGKGLRDVGAVSQTLSMPSDTNKLKKHIGLFVDRITKEGMNISEELKAAEENNKAELPLEDKLAFDLDDSLPSEALVKAEDYGTTVPLGSKLGEDRARSARIRSARLMSAKPRISNLVEEESVESTSSEYPESAIEEPSPSEDVPEPRGRNSPIYEEIAEEPVMEDEEEPFYADINELNQMKGREDTMDSTKEDTVEETPQSIEEDGLDGSREGIEEDGRDGIREDIEEDGLDGIREGSEEDGPDVVKEGIEEDGIKKDAEEDALDGLKEGINEGTEEDGLDGIKKDAEEDGLDGVIEGIEDNGTDGINEGTEEDGLDGIKEGTKEDIRDGITDDSKDDTLDGIKGDTDEDALDISKDNIAEKPLDIMNKDTNEGDTSNSNTVGVTKRDYSGRKMKKALNAKENVIEAPEDIFGNPIGEDDTW